MKSFLLEIVTPEKLSYSQEVEMVSVPSAAGILAILPGHIPLMANLADGEIKIRKNGEDYFLAIGGGFLEVSKEKTVILVTRAVSEDELNEKAILKAKQEAEEALAKKPSGEELKTAQTLLRSTLIDLKILGKRKKYRGPKVVISK